MANRILTDIVIQKLKPDRDKQRDYFDRACPGLAVRVSKFGTKSFVHFYYYRSGADKEQRRVTLGRYPIMSLAAAREIWQRQRQALAAGQDPQAIAEDDGEDGFTFGAVVADWLKRDQADNRTCDDIARRMRHAFGAWYGRPIETITRKEALAAIDAITDRGHKAAARNAHAHLARFFKWARSRDKVAVNILADTEKPPAPESRDRVLTDAELRIVWKAAGELGEKATHVSDSKSKHASLLPAGFPWCQFFRLLILTGARRDEIASLEWKEIHDDRIEIAGARMKNGSPHIIPLVGATKAILDSLPEISDVFALSTTSTSPISGFSKAKRTLDAACTRLNDGKPLADWRPHDFRRTVATGMERLGIAQPVVEAVLAHRGSKAGIAGVYSRHDFKAEKRKALQQWADKVAALVADNVVPLKPRRRKAG